AKRTTPARWGENLCERRVRSAGIGGTWAHARVKLAVQKPGETQSPSRFSFGLSLSRARVARSDGGRNAPVRRSLVRGTRSPARKRRAVGQFRTRRDVQGCAHHGSSKTCAERDKRRTQDRRAQSSTF